MNIDKTTGRSPLGWGGLEKFEGRARRATIGLWLICVVLALHAVVTMVLVFTGESFRTAWLIYDLLSLWYLLLLAITAFLFIQWLRSARHNLAGYGRRSQFSDSAAVYWWFVPVANLFMPFQVVKEVVDESRAMTRVDVPSDRSPLWWGLFVGGYLVSLTAALVAAGRTTGVEGLLVLEAVAAASMSVAAFFAVGIVSSVTRIQTGEAGWS